MRARDFTKFCQVNDGTRLLYESIIAPEVITTLRDWLANYQNQNEPILVGGLAVSHWVKPRYTEDVDLLFISRDQLPDKVPGFTRTRPHAFQHKKTQVEVEVLDPAYLKIPQSTIDMVFKTSIIDTKDKIRIASPSGLVAMKLFPLRSKDETDIIALINSGQKIDVDSFGLSDDQISRLIELSTRAKHEKDTELKDEIIE